MAVATTGLVAGGSLLSGVVSLGIVALAWRHRENPAAPAFGCLLVAIGGWSLFTAGFVLARDPAVAYLFHRLLRVSMANVAPLFLVFVVAYAGHTRWLTPRWLGALWAYPAAYCLLVLTGAWHGLAAGPTDVTVLTVGGVTAPYVPEYAVESVRATLAFATVFVAFVVLFRFLLRSRSTHHDQAVAIGVGAFIPVAAGAAFHLGWRFHPGVDLAPLTFTLSGVVAGWAVFRHDFLDASPVATDILVERLPDPVLILDDDGRVVDYNPAAVDSFGDGIAGRDVSDVAPGLREALGGDEVYSVTDARVTDGGAIRFYDPQVTRLTDQHDIERGRLVVLRDVTGQQRRQDRLEALQAATQRFITAGTDEEIADMAVDFASRVLDQHAAAVYLYDADEDALRPAALSESVRAVVSDEVLLAAGRDSPVRRTFDEGSTRSVDVADDAAADPFARLLLVPVGDQGVLAVGSENAESFPQEDEQFATILARTTQVALEQVEREQELRRSRSAVERRSEQIEFFNGVLRHTLRNALLVIQGRAEFLRDEVPPDQEDHVDRIVRWTDDLAELSAEIRAINDTVTATESERLDAVDLSATIRERAAAVDDETDDLDVVVDVEDGLTVQANELADRVIDSVVENAVRHNDSPDPRVEIRTRPAADRVQVHVADNGPGMSDELKATVFERDLATSHTANGFGLYFVSVIMNLYGGTVWFEDNDPRGTVAVLEFQVAPAEAETETQGTSPAE